VLIANHIIHTSWSADAPRVAPITGTVVVVAGRDVAGLLAPVIRDPRFEASRRALFSSGAHASAVIIVAGGDVAWQIAFLVFYVYQFASWSALFFAVIAVPRAILCKTRWVAVPVTYTIQCASWSAF
jgi:hypothetical protein